MGDVARAATLYQQTMVDPIAGLPGLRRAAADPDDLVRHVAMVQLAFHCPAELTEAAIHELLATLLRVSRIGDNSAIAREYAAATDEDCWDLGQHIALALARLPVGSADFAVSELVSLWQRDRQFYEAALAAIALSFPEADHFAATAVSESQRAVLVALVRDEAVWTCCGDTSPILVARGLPGTRRGMESFLTSAAGPA
jgi:hypothetical protein